MKTKKSSVLSLRSLFCFVIILLTVLPLTGCELFAAERELSEDNSKLLAEYVSHRVLEKGAALFVAQNGSYVAIRGGENEFVYVSKNGEGVCKSAGCVFYADTVVSVSESRGRLGLELFGNSLDSEISFDNCVEWLFQDFDVCKGFETSDGYRLELVYGTSAQKALEDKFGAVGQDAEENTVIVKTGSDYVPISFTLNDVVYRVGYELPVITLRVPQELPDEVLLVPEKLKTAYENGSMTTVYTVALQYDDGEDGYMSKVMNILSCDEGYVVEETVLRGSEYLSAVEYVSEISVRCVGDKPSVYTVSNGTSFPETLIHDRLVELCGLKCATAMSVNGTEISLGFSEDAAAELAGLLMKKLELENAGKCSVVHSSGGVGAAGELTEYTCVVDCGDFTLTFALSHGDGEPYIFVRQELEEK